MIRIEQDYGQTLYIPKPAKTQELAYLVIHSELTQKDYTFEMGDVEEGDYEVDKNFYKVVIDASSIPEGEYNYTLTDEAGEEAGTGLLVIGDPETISKTIIQYGSEIEYTQYYPSIKSFITLETDEHLSESATAITYHVRTNSSWSLQVFIRHHTQSEWSPWPPESHTEKNYYGTINIGPQVEDYPKHFKIVVTTKDGEASAEQEIVQDAHYYFSVDVFSPYESISWSATELSYGIQYSEYQSVHTGKFLIYKDEELYLEQPFGWYPYGFSTYTQIPANSGETDVSWTVTGILDNGQTDSCTVIQEAYAEEPTDYSKKRFTIEMLEDGDINWEGRGYEYYDIIRDGERDEGNQLDHGVINLKAGDIVEFYLMVDNTNRIDTPITSTAKHNVYGNVMSLCYAYFENVSACTRVSQFSGMFKNDEGIVSAEYLILPEVCTDSCFMNMFNGCSSLVKAPSLPATTLKASCYAYMFQNCTSLTTAPELPASEINNSSYDTMFSGCTSLNYIKCLAESGNREGLENCRRWVSGVAASGTFVKKTGINWPNGINGIPDGWTVVNTDE